MEVKKHWKKQELIYKELHSRKYPGWKRPPRSMKKKKASVVSDPNGGDTTNEQPGDAGVEEELKELEIGMDIGLLTEDGQRITASDLFSHSQIQEAKRYVMNLLKDSSDAPPKTTNAALCERSANITTKPIVNGGEIEPSPLVLRSDNQDSEHPSLVENKGSAAQSDSSEVVEDPDFEQLYREELEPQCTPQSNGTGIASVGNRKVVKAAATVEEYASHDGAESPSVSCRSPSKGRKLSTPGVLPGPCFDIPKKRNRSFSEADVHPPAVRVRSELGLARVLGTT